MFLSLLYFCDYASYPLECLLSPLTSWIAFSGVSIAETFVAINARFCGCVLLVTALIAHKDEDIIQDALKASFLNSLLKKTK